MPVFGTALPFITLFPAVFASAYLGGMGPALLATFLSVLAALYLFIEPLHSLSLAEPVAQLGTALFVVIGTATGLLGEARLRAHRRARIAAALAETEAARAEQEALRAEEESARAEEEMLQAEEQTARAEHEARRAARESERVDRIISSITDAFMVLDRDWTITYMNERAAALSGRKAADYVGRNHWEAFPESIGGPFDQAYRRALAGEHAVRVEAYYPPIGKWIQATVYPWAEGLTVVAQDVTDRVRSHELTTRLAAIVASSEDAIIGEQLDGTVLTWNTGAERIFGYTASEMIGQPIFQLIPPELHSVERDVLHRVARGEPVESKEAERIRSDGKRIYIAMTVSPIRDESGQVVGASSIKRDITEQKRTQAALAAESARSRELAQALDVSQAMMHEIDGRISYWSSGSARLFGWSVSEALGRVYHELLKTEFPLPLDEILAGLQARGRWEGELIHVAKDGRRVFVASQWILRRGQANESLAVIQVNTDVTARRQAEERMRQSERMEVVGQLAGGVAHEANNQMTVVLGAANFLLGRTDLPDEARKDLEYIREAAERTAGITAQLLAFSRRQMIQARVLDLDEAVQGLDGVLRRALGERSKLVLQLRAKARVKVDPGQLTQVLLNLVLNARDAMPLGGRLTIETGVKELTEGYARHHPGIVIHPGPYAVLAISDIGHGMSPETLARIFEPFYTTKPMGKGTGLGLATVYGIVKQSSGYVWAYSELGQGSTFKVYLPLETAATSETPAASEPARAAGQTLLLVEDDAAVRHMAARALREYGYLVLEADGGHQALETVERSGKPIDLLITDVILQGMDGPELARRATQLRPTLPVLFVSGYTDEDIVRRGLLEAGHPFLQKPFTPEALSAEVATLLKGSQLGRSTERA
jgi:two-component system cell cycle sensor histidine kinase/response regulator CckA